MTRILFSGDGSSGDLLPMVLMAREFKLAGYDVCVCGSSEQAKMARDFGVRFEGYPHNYSDLYLERQRPGYIHSIRENIRHQVMLYQGEYDLLSKIAPDFDVVINFLAELFVPAIAEAFKLPNIKLFTFPMVRSELYGPPTGLPFVSEKGWVNSLQWDATEFAAKHLFAYGATLNRLRANLNLPPTDRILEQNGKFDHMMVGLYEELMPPCESWRGKFDHTYIGPCLPKTKVRLSDALEAFIGRGSQPIYVGFGSMRHGTGDRLTRLVLDAARDAGVRVVLARNGSKIGDGIRESDDVFILRDYPIPHHVLFPRLRAAVHQGSWIATHLAAQAGIPQLVVPQASDQYLWSHVVRKNGLGPHGVDMNRITRAKLATAFEQLTSNQGYDAAAQALGERVRGIDGAKNAVRLFQRLEPRLLGRSSVSSTGHSRGVAHDARRRALARWSSGNAVRQEEEGEEVAGEG
jgi:UDP:flavonoid glycosyltransferase YjiC (YdhE family)